MMRSPPFLYFLAVFIASVASSPANVEQVHKRAPNCTFIGSTGAAQASLASKSCPTITLFNIAVPAGTTFDLSALASNTTVIFEGTTTWGYQEWDGSLLQIGGKNIAILGAPGAILNPDGARWWDGSGDSGKVKPKFFAAHNLVDSTINSLTIKNTPRQAVSIAGCRNLTITGMTIDNSAGDAGSPTLGHNTDAFDIGTSENVVIDGATVWNQDDCVAVNSGVNVTFKNGFCSGGHGLSIGSVGGRSDNTVDTVTFSNSTVQKSVNGIRIKTKGTETRLVKDVTYTNITLNSVSKYGILIEQNYNGGDLHGVAGTGIPITGLTLSNIGGVGAVTSNGYDVVVTCGSSASCTNWTWTDVSVTGGRMYGSCTNVPGVTECS